MSVKTNSMQHELAVLDATLNSLHCAVQRERGPIRARYIDHVYTITDRLPAGVTKEELKHLLAHWCTRITWLYAHGGATPDARYKYLTRFIVFATDHALIRTLSDNPESARILGCACVTMADLVRRGYMSYESSQLADVIQQWTGEKQLDETLSSVEHMTDYLFGPGCYAFYGSDVDYIGDFPQYLWELAVPSVVKNTVPVGLKHELPNTDLI